MVAAGQFYQIVAIQVINMFASDPSNDEVRAQLNRLLHFLRTSNPDIFTLNKVSSNYETLCRGEVDEMASVTFQI